ncbi:hypothetical protein [Paenibacillus sp. DMB5]|uniref:hypothetical protein n=1 Tax=Paenibacillus sp. DMB5 TaxID=1780103 RepID=UPI000A4BA9E4|nr:hypothetical protein [Paenibacillus sp. DMB5]
MYTETGAALQAALPFQGILKDKTLYVAHSKLFSIYAETDTALEGRQSRFFLHARQLPSIIRLHVPYLI